MGYTTERHRKIRVHRMGQVQTKLRAEEDLLQRIANKEEV